MNKDNTLFLGLCYSTTFHCALLALILTLPIYHSGSYRRSSLLVELKSAADSPLQDRRTPGISQGKQTPAGQALPGSKAPTTGRTESASASVKPLLTGEKTEKLETPGTNAKKPAEQPSSVRAPSRDRAPSPDLDAKTTTASSKRLPSMPSAGKGKNFATTGNRGEGLSVVSPLARGKREQLPPGPGGKVVRNKPSGSSPSQGKDLASALGARWRGTELRALREAEMEAKEGKGFALRGGARTEDALSELRSGIGSAGGAAQFPKGTGGGRFSSMNSHGAHGSPLLSALGSKGGGGKSKGKARGNGELPGRGKAGRSGSAQNRASDVLSEIGRGSGAAGRELLPSIPGKAGGGALTSAGGSSLGRAPSYQLESRGAGLIGRESPSAGGASSVNSGPSFGGAGNFSMERGGGAEYLSSPAPGDKDKEREPQLGIPVPEALLSKDIKIEIIPEGEEMPGILVRLLKKAYGRALEKNSQANQMKVEMKEGSEPGPRPQKTFSVADAGKGIYTLIVENQGNKPYISDVVITLYGGSKGERVKRYKADKFAHGASLKLRFILPDALFWDDDDRFSGSIEDSNSITKFTFGKTFLWKEEKDQ